MKAHTEDNASHDELRHENRRLREMIEAYRRINTSLDLKQVLKNTLISASELMKAEIGSIALINPEKTHLEFYESTDKDFDRLQKLTVPLGEGIAGHVALTGKSVRLEDVHTDRRFYDKIDEKMGVTTQSYLCVPLAVIESDEIIGTAQMLNRRDGRPFTEEDLRLMEGFARQAAMAIQNAQMHQILLEQKEIEAELRVCARLQQKLFPETFPDIPGLEVFASSIPCSEVGGDYYTFLPRDDGSWDIIIADVTGKGLSAALTVSELHAAIHLLSQMNYSLERIVQTLHDRLSKSLISGKYISLFAAHIPPDSHKMTYVLAGHPPPAVIHPRGDIMRLERTGAVLGFPSAPPLRSNEFRLDAGDVLFAFTDGYNEASNPQGDFFEEERMFRLILDCFDLNLPEIRNRLDDSIREFSQNTHARDDATLLLVRKAG